MGDGRSPTDPVPPRPVGRPAIRPTTTATTTVVAMADADTTATTIVGAMAAAATTEAMTDRPPEERGAVPPSSLHICGFVCASFRTPNQPGHDSSMVQQAHVQGEGSARFHDPLHREPALPCAG